MDKKMARKSLPTDENAGPYDYGMTGHTAPFRCSQSSCELNARCR
jgi:hypothetical protein